MATEHQYRVTDPDGQQYTFCSACCLLYFACIALPADLSASTDVSERSESEAAA
jgi:hypothetical protein